MRHWFKASWALTSSQAEWNDSGADRRLAALITVRREFVESLLDVRTERAFVLLERIRAARSLRELWHLRPDVFNMVARFHAQAEAERRLAILNRHFPTRSPRSGFGALGASEIDR